MAFDSQTILELVRTKEALGGHETLRHRGSLGKRGILLELEEVLLNAPSFGG